MCYGLTSSNSMRVAAKMLVRRPDGHFYTPGLGSSSKVPIILDRWTLSPTPHGWHAFGTLEESMRMSKEKGGEPRIVFIAGRGALCAQGAALIYLPSDPLRQPPPPPLKKIPSWWQTVRSRKYGTVQKSIVISVMEHGEWRTRLSSTFMYRMSALDSIKRVVDDWGWKLSYPRYPRDVKVSA